MTADPSTPPETVPAPSPAVPPKPRTPVRRRRSPMVWIAIVVVVIIIIAVLAVGYQQKWFGGSSGTKAAACATGVTLQGDGAQFAQPLMAAWAASYASSSNNHVNYPASGSGTGLTHFSEHPPLLDFAVTDDPLSPAQRAAMPAQPLTIPIAGGSLAIVYNLPGIAGHLNLTGAVLAEIYQGTVTTWNNAAIAGLNPGVTLPGSSIITVHRSDPAGTTYVLTDFLSQESAGWNSSIGKGISVNFPTLAGGLAQKGNSLVLSTVTSTPNAIGYSDLTDVLSDTHAVQYAAIENPEGNFIAPNLANTASAIASKVASISKFPSSTGDWYNVSMVNAPGTSDYPLATFVYLFVYQEASAGAQPSQVKTQVLVQWLHFVLGPGQAQASETSPTPLYYVALPSAVLSVSQSGISTMTWNGAAIPACT